MKYGVPWIVSAYPQKMSHVFDVRTFASYATQECGAHARFLTREKWIDGYVLLVYISDSWYFLPFLCSTNVFLNPKP
jgi:hypothetical protein